MAQMPELAKERQTHGQKSYISIRVTKALKTQDGEFTEGHKGNRRPKRSQGTKKRTEVHKVTGIR